MHVARTAVVLCLAAFLPLLAQTSTRRTVRAIGEATVTITPDQVKMSFAVETRGSTAQEAAAANANQTGAVLGALAAVLRSDGSIRTLGYSLHAVYGSQQTLTGYQAVNTVEVTLHNLARTGEVLDAGTKAGANRVAGLVFGLKDPEPARLSALRQAAAKARARAEAMAIGLGLRLGAILNIEEGGVARIVELDRSGAPAAATPIEVGNVSVTATLILEMEIL
jgi:uncharacterized protein